MSLTREAPRAAGPHQRESCKRENGQRKSYKRENVERKSYKRETCERKNYKRETCERKKRGGGDQRGRVDAPHGTFLAAGEREFFIDNLLVRILFIIEMIWWTGLAPWEFEFPFPGSLTSTFLWAAGPSSVSVYLG